MGRKRKTPKVRKEFRISGELDTELDIFFLQHRGVKQGVFAEQALRAELAKRGHLWAFPQTPGHPDSPADATQQTLKL